MAINFPYSFVRKTKAIAAHVQANFDAILAKFDGNIGASDLSDVALLNATKHGNLSSSTATMHTAESIKLVDTSSYYTGGEVEAALQEAGLKLNGITNIWTGTKLSSEFTTDASGHTKITVTLADHSIPTQSDTSYFVIIAAFESGSTSAGFTPPADEKFPGYDYIRHMIPTIVSQKTTTTTFDIRFTDIANNQFTGMCKFDFIIIRNT